MSTLAQALFVPVAIVILVAYALLVVWQEFR